MMENKRPDRRKERTKRQLRQALLSLISEKGYDSLTIEEIASRADVGRTTFYLHYKDRDELLMACIETIANELIESVGKVPEKVWEKALELTQDEAYIKEIQEYSLFKHAEENADLYRIILNEGCAIHASRRVRDIMTKVVQEFLTRAVNERGLRPIVPINIVASFYGASIVGVLTWWLDKGMAYRSDQMVDMFSNIFLLGAIRMLGVQPGAISGS